MLAGKGGSIQSPASSNWQCLCSNLLAAPAVKSVTLVVTLQQLQGYAN
jgi:hypothetical protein